ncbi:hypothetical protein JCM5350_001304 [Sporobolomyces pararoseus]
MSSSYAPAFSPSSLSSPSLRSSPFSILPPELTQLIIEHTVPHSFHSSTYKSRQSTLRSLCLVSKSFHHFARPLLFATFWIKPSGNHEGWTGVHARGDDKSLCRELILYEGREKLLLDVDLAGYAGLYLSVLRLLTIAVSASTPFSLTNLKELSLCQPNSVTDQARILSPSTLPALRLFACYNEGGLLSGNSKGLDLLIPQLHMVALDFNLIKSLTPELLKKLDPITLFDAEIEDLEQAIPISYLRVCDFFDHWEDFAYLAERLSQAQLSLPLTIFLPLEASPAAADDEDDGDKRLHLLRVCAGRGIEVVAWISRRLAWRLGED